MKTSEELVLLNEEERELIQYFREIKRKDVILEITKIYADSDSRRVIYFEDEIKRRGYTVAKVPITESLNASPGENQKINKPGKSVTKFPQK